MFDFAADEMRRSNSDPPAQASIKACESATKVELFLFATCALHCGCDDAKFEDGQEYFQLFCPFRSR